MLAAAAQLIDAVQDVGFDADLIEDKLPPDLRLRVEGMMCQNTCGTTIENALRELPGIAWAGMQATPFGRSKRMTSVLVDLVANG